MDGSKEHDEPARTDGGQAMAVGGESHTELPREVPTWELVPAAREGTVPVRWADLKAMRRRIDDLEREVDRLETELERSRDRRRQTVARYERLLDSSGMWGSSVPRFPLEGEERATAASDGHGAERAESEHDREPEPTPESGRVGRLLSAVGAVLGWG